MATLQKKSKTYGEFVDKFKPKLTTDDCYTPADVYDAVLAYVRRKYDIAGLKVIRPFYPGGDYQKEDYTGAVVIDNPPFSIGAQIIDFYCNRQVPFFLFANGLTAFCTSKKHIQHVSVVLCSCAITYENRAKVRTSFITNMGPADIILAGELQKDIAACPSQSKTYIHRTERLRNEHNSADLYKAARLVDGTDVALGGTGTVSPHALYGGARIFTDEMEAKLNGIYSRGHI